PKPPVQAPPKLPVQAPPKPPVQAPPKLPVQAPPKPPVQAPSEPSVEAPVQKKEELDKLGMLLQKLQDKSDQPNIPAPPESIGVSNSILTKKEVPPKPPVTSNLPLANSGVIEKSVESPELSKINAENVKTDLKIKIANVNKNLLDLEMQNITGELSDEDFQDKTKKLESIKKKLEDQLKNISEL
ncbi:MAG: hypothetical protein ACTSWX_12710, partial [Promethearchaeota archaeon]